MSDDLYFEVRKSLKYKYHRILMSMLYAGRNQDEIRELLSTLDFRLRDSDYCKVLSTKDLDCFWREVDRWKGEEESMDQIAATILGATCHSGLSCGAYGLPFRNWWKLEEPNMPLTEVCLALETQIQNEANFLEWLMSSPAPHKVPDERDMLVYFSSIQMFVSFGGDETAAESFVRIGIDAHKMWKITFRRCRPLVQAAGMLHLLD